MYSLYIKTHKVTGLKYLGFTKQNPYLYTGSGTYWKSHLTIHGNYVETLILFESDNKEEIKEHGLYYSNLWNIVNSKDSNGKKLWANLKDEDGYGGSMPESRRVRLVGTLNGRYDYTEYDFYNLYSAEHLRATPYYMTRVKGVDKCLIRKLITHKIHRLGDWSTTPVETYLFTNSNLNLSIIATRYKFCKLYNIRSGIIKEVIQHKNRRKSYKGWEVSFYDSI